MSQKLHSPTGGNLIFHEIDARRASLKHTWLERRLLGQLRTERGTWLKERSQRLPNVLAGLSGRIQEIRSLLADIVEGYSPRQLIDHGPLGILPDEVRQAIKAAVHQAYLELGIMQPLVAELEGALNQFERIAEKVIGAWEDGALVKKRAQILDELEVATERLRQALDAFPRGVVLP